jgi:dTDP-D-glucose 4,6-dehydratase
LYSILRISTPFGPGEASTKVIPTLLMNAFLGKDLTLFGSKESTQNYCYVSDIPRVFTKCLDSAVKGTFNVGSKYSTKLIDLAREILAIFPHTKS